MKNLMLPLLVALAAATLYCAQYWWNGPQRAVLTDNDVSPAAQNPSSAPGRSAQPAQADLAETSAPGAAALDDGYQQALKKFLALAPELPPEALTSQAQQLRKRTLEREAQGLLLPAESAYNQLAILRVLRLDESAYQAQGAELLERYQARSEHGWNEYLNNPDPQHLSYRQAESELVQRARAEAWSSVRLRERLQALRAAHYR